MLRVIERDQEITEQNVLLPLAHVFEQTSLKPTISTSLDISSSAVKTIQELFPEQEYEEKNIQLAKKSLGALSAELSPEELKNCTNEVRFLTESWLDEFERKIFKGLTLQELLHEKGGQ